MLRQPHHPPAWVTVEIPGILGVKIPYYTSVEDSRCKEGENNNNQVSIIARFSHTCAANARRSAFQVDWDSKQLLQLEGLLSGQIQPDLFVCFLTHSTACAMFYSPKFISCDITFRKSIVKIMKCT